MTHLVNLTKNLQNEEKKVAKKLLLIAIQHIENDSSSSLVDFALDNGASDAEGYILDTCHSQARASSPSSYTCPPVYENVKPDNLDLNRKKTNDLELANASADYTIQDLSRECLDNVLSTNEDVNEKNFSTTQDICEQPTTTLNLVTKNKYDDLSKKGNYVHCERLPSMETVIKANFSTNKANSYITNTAIDLKTKTDFLDITDTDLSSNSDRNLPHENYINSAAPTIQFVRKQSLNSKLILSDTNDHILEPLDLKSKSENSLIDTDKTNSIAYSGINDCLNHLDLENNNPFYDSEANGSGSNSYIEEFYCNKLKRQLTNVYEEEKYIFSKKHKTFTDTSDSLKINTFSNKNLHNIDLEIIGYDPHSENFKKISKILVDSEIDSRVKKLEDSGQYCNENLHNNSDWKFFGTVNSEKVDCFSSETNKEKLSHKSSIICLNKHHSQNDNLFDSHGKDARLTSILQDLYDKRPRSPPLNVTHDENVSHSNQNNIENNDETEHINNDNITPMDNNSFHEHNINDKINETQINNSNNTSCIIVNPNNTDSEHIVDFLNHEVEKKITMIESLDGISYTMPLLSCKRCRKEFEDCSVFENHFQDCKNYMSCSLCNIKFAHKVSKYY